MTLAFKAKFNFNVKFTTFWVCEFVRALSHHWLKSGFLNLDQKCILALLRSLLILGLTDLDLQFHCLSQTCAFLPNFASLIHLLRFVYIKSDHHQWMLHIPQGTAHIWILICTWTGSRRGPWNSLVLYLGGTIGAVDSTIGTGFYKLLSVFANLYTPRMTQSYMPTFGTHRNNNKTAPISVIWFDFHWETLAPLAPV